MWELASYVGQSGAIGMADIVFNKAIWSNFLQVLHRLNIGSVVDPHFGVWKHDKFSSLGAAKGDGCTSFIQVRGLEIRIVLYRYSFAILLPSTIDVKVALATSFVDL
jgi:hypothetical protein